MAGGLELHLAHVLGITAAGDPRGEQERDLGGIVVDAFAIEVDVAEPQPRPGVGLDA